MKGNKAILGIVALIILFLEVFIVVVGISTADSSEKIGAISNFGSFFVFVTVVVTVVVLASAGGSSQDEEKDTALDKQKNGENIEVTIIGDDGELVSKPISIAKSDSKSEGG